MMRSSSSCPDLGSSANWEIPLWYIPTLPCERIDICMLYLTSVELYDLDEDPYQP